MLRHSKTPNDELIMQANDRTHASSPIEVEATKIKVDMKRKTKITKEKVQQILAEQLGNISEDGAANLPSISTMRRNIRKVQEDDNSSQIPVNLENTPVL